MSGKPDNNFGLGDCFCNSKSGYGLGRKNVTMLQTCYHQKWSHYGQLSN